MSLESVLKNLTDAINANTEATKAMIAGGTNPAPPAKLTNVAGVNQPAPEKPAAPPAPEKPAAPPAPEKPDAPPAPEKPDAIITPEELNAALVEEFNRLGNREGIDAELKKLGVTGVSDLPANQYQTLIDAVKALQ